jgi:hypothetical protein
MSFVSLDVDVVDAADNLNHCCCNVFDDLVNGGGDDSFYLKVDRAIVENTLIKIQTFNSSLISLSRGRRSILRGEETGI